MRERNHEIMLKQEQRKLREGDMLKVAQRRKRLELKRKIDIIEKEKRDIEVREEIKRRERILIDTRYENTVRCNMERMNFTNDVLLWSHSGYATDKATRKRLQLNHSPRIELMIAEINKKPASFVKALEEQNS